MVKSRYSGLFATVAGALMLSACGGGGFNAPVDPGTLPPSTTPTVGSVTLLLSSAQLSSSASEPANGVTLTAVVKDLSNNVIPNLPVTFTATSGTLIPTGTTPGITDASGVATAVLTTGGDPTNRIITVTATAGGISDQGTVEVLGTRLTIVGPSALGRGDSGTYVVTLTNSSGAGIGGTAVNVSSQAGNTLSAATLTTNVSGQANVQLTASTTATSDVLSASALGLTAQTGAITISQQQFRFLSPAPPPATLTEVALNTAQTIVVELLTSGAPTVGTTVFFSSTRGSLTCISSCVTDGAGLARATISATTAGLATLQASAGALTAQTQLEFVSVSPTRLDLQASPAVIATNSQSEITAIVRDANDNLVKNQRVEFTLTDQSGGSLTTPSAITDSQGLARTIYRSSSTASGSNGVTIDAVIRDGSGAIITTAQSVLTVGSQALRITLGTGNAITEPTSTTYKLPYVAIVSDAAGNPAPNASFTLSVRSLSYRKGEFFKLGSWVIPPTRPDTGGPNGITCPNEDVDFNGINEGEDTDGDGVLDPGNVATAPVTVTLNPDGTAQFDITYPQDRAYWVKVQLTARARVAGTETTETAEFDLPGSANDYASDSPAPPGQVSPYGIVQDCTNPN